MRPLRPQTLVTCIMPRPLLLRRIITTRNRTSRRSMVKLHPLFRRINKAIPRVNTNNLGTIMVGAATIIIIRLLHRHRIRQLTQIRGLITVEVVNS